MLARVGNASSPLRRRSGSGSARAREMASRAVGAAVAAVAVLLLLAPGAEPIGLWLPPPTGGGGRLGGAAAPGRYLTQEERWMDQTLDHFNPTVESRSPTTASSFGFSVELVDPRSCSVPRFCSSCATGQRVGGIGDMGSGFVLCRHFASVWSLALSESSQSIS